jgi:hypothetical protein
MLDLVEFYIRLLHEAPRLSFRRTCFDQVAIQPRPMCRALRFPSWHLVKTWVQYVVINSRINTVTIRLTFVRTMSLCPHLSDTHDINCILLIPHQLSARHIEALQVFIRREEQIVVRCAEYSTSPAQGVSMNTSLDFTAPRRGRAAFQHNIMQRCAPPSLAGQWHRTITYVV